MKKILTFILSLFPKEKQECFVPCENCTCDKKKCVTKCVDCNCSK